MAVAPFRKVILGTFAFLVFWTSATFPSFPGLPIGRTAGAIVGAALMVIFQIESPDDAYNAVNLPILGLLYGTMVVSVYLERADMFKYLAHALTWKCQGGKELLIRLSFLVAISSAIFTNDTCCVVFTEFVLQLCHEHGLPREPFLLALASSANLGSSATPIGNPQNLVIAIQSKIPFGKFLVGIFPAMIVGVTVNTLLLLLIYRKQLSASTDNKFHSYDDNKAKGIPTVIDVDPPPKHISAAKNDKEPQKGLWPNSHEHAKPYPNHTMDVVKPNSTANSNELTTRNHSPPHHDASILNCIDEGHLTHSCRSLGMVENINHFYDLELNHSHHGHRNSFEGSTDVHPLSPVDHHYGEKALNTFAMLDQKRHHVSQGLQTLPSVADRGTTVDNAKRSDVAMSEREIKSSTYSPRSLPTCQSPLWQQHHDNEFHIKMSHEPHTKMSLRSRLKENLWKCCVYLVAIGMLVALLAGLNLSWSTLSAAIALIVLDFTDAGPNLNKVSYSLLVFFSGMFITVDGFNKTGLPATLWNAIEPYARINHASGVVVLTCMIMLLSNIASNVPTVLLLGPRVAASSATLAGASVAKSWLILAWASTIAGNLTLVGSAANLIVCEKARTAPMAAHHLSFWRHFRYGFPSTLLIVAIGVPLIHV